MINEVLLTIAVIAVAMASVFIIGFPMVSLAARQFEISCTPEQLWAAAPLVGAGAIILICQNLLYLDVRSSYSAVLIWAVIGLGAINFISKLQSIFASIPWKLIGTGVAIYAIHGSGLLVSGASNYYGYGFGDMYNYVATAQFFMDFPFHSAVATQEYLQTGHFYQLDRIGQSVLHAFIASSSGADAQQAFGATILLSPMLIFFSLFLLGACLGIERRFAYPAAIIASLSPAVANVHLECFFSQAMAIPFIFLWPLAISRLRSHQGVRSSLMAGLLFAVTAAIYTEVIAPLMVITAVVSLASYCSRRGEEALQSQTIWYKPQGGFASLALLSLTLVIGIAANGGYLKNAIGVMERTTGSGVLDFIYPWALKSEGLARLWIGNQVLSPSKYLLYSLVVASSAVVLAAFACVGSLYRRNSMPVLLSCTLIACIPLAPLFLSVFTINKYPYQFFKLLLMVWPLILFLATNWIAELLSKRCQRRCAAYYFQIALICVCLGLTNRLAIASTKPETVANSARGGVHLLIDENFKLIRSLLGRLEGRRIYIWWVDNALYNGNWRGRWLAYYARKNDVWMFNPTPPSGSGGSPLAFLPIDPIKTPVLGISWKEIPIGTREKLGSFLAGTDPFWVYSLATDSEVRRLDHELSRYLRPFSRVMRLSVDQHTEPDTWYPLWAVGQPGAATLVSINFGKSGVRFRYDHWGYRIPIINAGGRCEGAELLVSVGVDENNGKLSLSCNGWLGHANIVQTKTYLGLEDPLGINGVTETLEGKYPLAKTFPGKITELPTDNSLFITKLK
jgi:hypothetical protein